MFISPFKKCKIYIIISKTLREGRKMNDINSKEKIAEHWGKHNRIRELKGDKTITTIAEIVDVDQGNLSRMLKGSSNISLFQFVQIAEAINRKPSELLPLDWQKETTLDKDKVYSDVCTVVKCVEEYLLNRKKTLSPADKAELIAGLRERVSDLPEDKKLAKVIEITDFILNMKRTG